MKIRDAEDGDFAAIAHMAGRSDLFVGELSEATFPSMLAWLYVETPSKIRLQFVAEHEEEVVAHYGAAPIEYKFYDDVCIAGFASNLVIDPEHRAGMLFISLQSYLQREYRKKNFRFVYGLVTRANVLEPHLRMGWKKIGTVPVYAKPFDFPAVAASALHPLARVLAFVPLKAAESLWRVRWSGRPGSVSVDEAARFDAGADRFFAEFTASLEIGAVRSREILNWRFAGYPERGYRLFVARQNGHVAGYVVTRRMPLKHLDALVLVDIAFDPVRGEVGKALLRHCDREAMRVGVQVTAAIMNPSSPFAPYLRRFGYLRSPESFTLVVHAPRGASGPPWSEALFPHWHVTWFDHDYV